MDNKNENSELKVSAINEEKITESTPQSNNKPQVVNINSTNEVNQRVGDSNSNQSRNNNNVTTNTLIEENKTLKQKKGHPIFLVLLMIFLFTFVFFLPDITEFITDYMNKSTGVNELKSGNMICRYSNDTENINYNYEFNFKYEKNRLKSSRMTTTSRLADTATDSSILTTKNNSCEFLKTVLDENDIGMTADCSVSAAVQITIQNIDYEKLDMNFITDNITEFEGFYPEYELNQSVTTIEQELENSGYTCERNEN